MVYEGNWHWHWERVSGPQRGKYALGTPATTVGMDFKGKTNSAAARQPASESVVEVYSLTSGVFCSVVDPLSDSSADSVGSEEST